MAIKVKGNYYNFVPAEFELIDGLEKFLPQVVTFQDANLLIDKVVGIHGSFSSEQDVRLFKGSGCPNLISIDIEGVERSKTRLIVDVTQTSYSGITEEESFDKSRLLQSESEAHGLFSNMRSKLI